MFGLDAEAEQSCFRRRKTAVVESGKIQEQKRDLPFDAEEAKEDAAQRNNAAASLKFLDEFLAFRSPKAGETALAEPPKAGADAKAKPAERAVEGEKKSS